MRIQIRKKLKQKVKIFTLEEHCYLEYILNTLRFKFSHVTFKPISILAIFSFE